jgi:hypothetical protein
MANQSFKNKESVQPAISHFKQEFRGRLSQIEEDQQAHDRDSESGDASKRMLDFNQVAIVMHSMGFLQEKLTNDQEDQIDDLYTLFKTHKDEKILAENLQNVLLVIDGQRDETLEAENAEQNNMWENACVYDEEGSIYVRQGEHLPIQTHFRLLRLNRLSQKKSLFNFAHKSAPEVKRYAPNLGGKTQ